MGDQRVNWMYALAAWLVLSFPLAMLAGRWLLWARTQTFGDEE